MQNKDILKIIVIIAIIFIGRSLGLMLSHEYNDNWLIKFMLMIVAISLMFSSAMQYAVNQIYYCCRNQNQKKECLVSD